MRHIERQNDLWTKNANNRFLSKIWEYWTDEHLCIVKLDSGGQQLPVIQQHLTENPLFLIKSTRNIHFYSNHRTLLHYPELKSRA